MCRLLALIEPSPKIIRDALGRFQQLARDGQVPPGQAAGHLDGWGLAFYEQKAVTVIKEPSSAADSALYEETAARLAHDPPRVLIGHLRKASVGGRSLANTHPFSYQHWAFCHNGNLKLDAPLPLAQPDRPHGQTDSEQYFYQIIEGHEAGLGLSDALAKVVAEQQQRGTYTAMNCLLTDGTKVLALREVNERHEAVLSQGLADSYYTLFMGCDESGQTRVVSSEMINLRGIIWRPIANHEVVALG